MTETESAAADREKIAQPIERMLAGILAPADCLAELETLRAAPAHEIWLYLRRQVLGELGEAAQALDAGQREHIQRILLFLRSDEPYLWPQPRTPRKLASAGCSVTIGLVFVAVCLAMCGVLLSFAFGWRMLIYLGAIPGGLAVLGLVGYLRWLRSAIGKWQSEQELIWQNPGAYTDEFLELSCYPFANRRQLDQARASPGT